MNSGQLPCCNTKYSKHLSSEKCVAFSDKELHFDHD